MNLATLTSNWTSSARDSAAVVQYGAMPYRVVEGRAAFLLITSRRTGRWIFPKGGLIDGMSPAKSAAQEAFEEAGVRGSVDMTPIGTYRTIKQRLRRTEIDVQVFPLLVEDQLDEWPEMTQRRRHWVLLTEAKRLLSDKGAISLAQKLNKRVTETG
ncbi:NUDIX hydrolase [Pararhizobium haloflavum]|uniref:NUDIX hydrolase n=1 Tax=Pararhizobium haloflavum TaxID=2037914 RepID=UPI000C195530|nr:NUDIX hydrolase [Pararhizobium haloflavum]